ncbi:hypothetical protein BCR44DRAFT_34283 [Catenaria anguillulae PL171]|uniref:Mitochondrial import inner membrane translocase subunit Tim21 n=1 Tax=Catenaria anguillulae PL171 TaxID=765915 RepID=A0A1Y2HN64_9FUNG|nr:hypothetical protein BCR44DRAFT_34283 [Catenaria anguillulae PL171]
MNTSFSSVSVATKRLIHCVPSPVPTRLRLAGRLAPPCAHQPAVLSYSTTPRPPQPPPPSGTWRASAKAQTAHGVVRKPSVLRKLAHHTYKVVRTGGQVGVVLVSIATGGLLLWAIGDDLLSTSSPNNIFKSTVKRLRNVTALTSVLGHDFRGLVDIDEDLHHWRSRPVSHRYVEDRWGRGKRLVMHFYLKSKSTGGMAKVTCEMRQEGGESGKWVYDKLVCECFLADGSQKTVRVV